MPQRAAFTLSFDIKPDEVKPEQVLFANEASTNGDLNISVKDGYFEFYYVARNLGHDKLPSWSRVSFKTDIPLIQGKWQKVTVTYDQSQISLTANGQTESFPLQGVGLYLQISGFGGSGGRTAQGVIPFFKGDLRAFEVKHFVEHKQASTSNATQ